MLDKLMKMMGMHKGIAPKQLEYGKEKHESEEDIYRKIQDVEEELNIYRSQFEQDWRTYEDFYYGKQHLTAGDKKTTKT